MARIKAIIFDLDDTLYDCSGALVDAARRRAAKAMVSPNEPIRNVWPASPTIVAAAHSGARASALNNNASTIFVLEVANLQQLRRVMKKVKRVKGVYGVERLSELEEES